MTFTVDDTDAVAARSRELGGSVLTEPYDIPPVRSAVIRDPQGRFHGEQLRSRSDRIGYSAEGENQPYAE